MAADLSARRGTLTAAEAGRVRKLVAAAGLPTRADGLAPDELLRAMRHDKKFAHGLPRFIVLAKLGQAQVAADVEPAHLQATLEAHCA
jgi:3-dehydroquinate synthase